MGKSILARLLGRHARPRKQLGVRDLLAEAPGNALMIEELTERVAELEEAMSYLLETVDVQNASITLHNESITLHNKTFAVHDETFSFMLKALDSWPGKTAAKTHSSTSEPSDAPPDCLDEETVH